MKLPTILRYLLSKSLVWTAISLGADRSDFSQERERIQSAMVRIMGPMPGAERRCPLRVQISEEINCGAFIRRFLTYESEPGSRVPAYLLIPKSVTEGSTTTLRRYPAVLTLHQTHPKAQRVVVGLENSPEDEYGEGG